MKPFVNFFQIGVDVARDRGLIFALAKSDFQKRYLGSYFGVIWPFVHPAITVLLFWFVFTFGLRTQPAGDYPFILWLLAGMIPGFYFSEALTAGPTSICEYAFLV
ncbi:MAG: ABC transporter permease, partial [Bdellovibrionales bacterium]